MLACSRKARATDGKRCKPAPWSVAWVAIAHWRLVPTAPSPPALVPPSPSPSPSPRHSHRRCCPRRRLLLRPGQHCCKSCAGAVRVGLAGTGFDHTKKVNRDSCPLPPEVLQGASLEHILRGFEFLCGGPVPEIRRCVLIAILIARGLRLSGFPASFVESFM